MNDNPSKQEKQEWQADHSDPSDKPSSTPGGLEYPITKDSCFERAACLINALSPAQQDELTRIVFADYREPQLKVIHNIIAQRALDGKLISDQTFAYIHSVVYPYAEWSDKSLLDRYTLCILVDEICRALGS